MSKATPQRIYSPNNILTEEDILDIARLLVKAGYTVRRGKQKLRNSKSSTKYIEFKIESEEESYE